MKCVTLQPKDTYTAGMFATRTGGVSPVLFAKFVLFSKCKPVYVKGKRRSLYYKYEDLLHLLVLYHLEKGRTLVLPDSN